MRATVARRRADAGDHDRLLRRQADALPGRLDRRARRQRHRQRPGRRRERGRWRSASRSCSRRGWRRTSCAPRSRRSPAPPAAAERRDRRRRHQGRRARPCRRDVRVHDRDRPARSARARSRRPRSCPATGSSSPGPIGEHGTAIMLARGRVRARRAEIESDTRSLWPAVDALLEAAGAELRCMRDATRGGVASVLNELARASGVAMRGARERRPRRSRRSQARRRSSGSTRCTSPTRASWSRSSHPRPPTPRWPRCGRCPGARRRPRSARCAPSRRRWCWWRRASAARRVMDQLVGDPLPRIC